MSSTEDTPPNSRLFIVCSKKDNLSEKDFQDAFSKFGTIEDVWFVRDKRTSTARGLCYIKFAKSSEACRAMEEMDGKSLPNSDKAMKIIIAANRNEGSVRKSKEAETINRIFVVVPPDTSSDEIKKHFQVFGEITALLMVRNNKFAYLTYSKASEAALAIEGCDRLTYKPRIADPPGYTKKRTRERSYSPPPPHPAYRRETYDDEYSSPRRYAPEPVPAPMSVSRGMYGGADIGMVDLSVCLINNPTRCSQLYMKVNYPLQRDVVWKLCSLVPGLEYVELHQEAAATQKTLAYVKYETAASAAWAWEKLQDFEYPPGYLIRIRYADAGFPPDWQAELSLTTGFHYQSAVQSSSAPSGRMMMGERTYGGDEYNGHGGGGHNSRAFGQGEMMSYGTPKNSIKLGPPKPILGRGFPYVDRVFVVCTNRLPMNVMEDAFSSFGDLVEFYYISNKNYGYATYATTDAAEKAIKTLNGEMLHGERLKVVKAEPEPNKDKR